MQYDKSMSAALSIVVTVAVTKPAALTGHKLG
jgi:hypothetical protein